jgi:hypothetical protein
LYSYSEVRARFDEDAIELFRFFSAAGLDKLTHSLKAPGFNP